MARVRNLAWLPGALAAIAFAGAVAAFAVCLLAYQRQVVVWAEQDLQSRAELAAMVLREPLRTLDLRAVHAFGEQCRAEGLRINIRPGVSGDLWSEARPGLYDSAAGAPRPELFRTSACGDYRIAIGRPAEQVYRPFHRALTAIALAGLVGMAGVALFFLVVYRQHVRIRELARLERFRREFIADISHEIKTPLTGILGAVEALGEVKAEGEGERSRVEATLLSLIKKESKRLNGLVQSILDLSRMEREGAALQREEVDLNELVREICVRHGCRLESSGACVASVDATLVSQAVENLVANAYRHSGSTDVAVDVRKQDGAITVTVEDHGIGIPPEHAVRIFERFYRVDPSRAAETGGAGLGLAIVRRIARLHGGDVTYAPAHPHGSRFTLNLG